MAEDLAKTAARMRDSQVVGLKNLRTFTGRLSWAATALPRLRWVVNILYAVLAAGEREAASTSAAEAQ